VRRKRKWRIKLFYEQFIYPIAFCFCPTAEGSAAKNTFSEAANVVTNHIWGAVDIKYLSLP